LVTVLCVRLTGYVFRHGFKIILAVLVVPSFRNFQIHPAPSVLPETMIALPTPTSYGSF